jgi:hypothetical protein
MKHSRRWIAAPLAVLVVACTGHTHTRVASVPPSSLPHGTPIGPPSIHTSSTSMPGAPVCEESGVMAAALKIVKEWNTNTAQAMADLKKASPAVKKCLTTPNLSTSSAGIQQVSP